MSSFLKLFLFSISILFLGSCQSDTNSTNTAATESVTEPTPKDLTNLLEGRWENTASNKEFIIFDEGKMISRFAGANVKEDKISNIFYNYYEKCHAPCQSQSVDADISKFQCFTVKEDGIYKCYKITKLDAAELHFTLTDGTGPAYIYKRLQ